MQEVAVIIPCLNEGDGVGGVIREFRAALPQATIYVCDNGSTDETSICAREAGAIVYQESCRGKGNAVKRMFADVEAEVYVLVDGDGTYDPADVQELVRRVEKEQFDMVTASRRESYAESGSRVGHEFGNRLITSSVNLLFNVELADVLSGYRAMSRRYVKSAPVLVSGFEVETMLTIHGLEVGATMIEIPTTYRRRPTGTNSKLRTWHDGFRILQTIVYFFKEIRPFVFFSLIAVLFVSAGLFLGIPVILEFMETGLVPRFPTALLATGLMVLASISLVSGMILDSVALQRREMKRFAYLGNPAPKGSREG